MQSMVSLHTIPAFCKVVATAFSLSRCDAKGVLCSSAKPFKISLIACACFDKSSLPPAALSASTIYLRYSASCLFTANSSPLWSRQAAASFSGISMRLTLPLIQPISTSFSICARAFVSLLHSENPGHLPHTPSETHLHIYSLAPSFESSEESAVKELSISRKTAEISNSCSPMAALFRLMAMRERCFSR